MTLNKPSTGNLYSSNFGLTVANTTATTTATAINTINDDDDQLPQPPLIVYGELSILGYNGYIPNTERNGRKNKSKFLLRKRPVANGIKKSRHYIVKQPQATKAIQDKDLHSISYTFSRSQTIIVEYRQDGNTDMFQIGRSSEDPIDFVVLDTQTASTNIEPSANNSSSSCTRDNHGSSGSRSNQHNEIDINSNNHHNHHHQQQQLMSHNNGLIGLNRFHRHLAKVSGGEMLHYPSPPPAHDSRNHTRYVQRHLAAAQALLLNYPQPNISNLPPLMADHFRNQPDSSISNYNHLHNNNHSGHSSGFQQIQSINSRPNGSNNIDNTQSEQHNSNRHSINICPKQRSHATQSTISRFACRILVDREPPYTARIYAAGFDSSKNIFLGEKATKWEQNDSIDGLTTNGVLLMHPKQKEFYINAEVNEFKQQQTSHTVNEIVDDPKCGIFKSSGDIRIKKKASCLNDQSSGNMFGESSNNINYNNNVSEQYTEGDNLSNINLRSNPVSNDQDLVLQSDRPHQAQNADTNNNSNDDHTNKIVSGPDNLMKVDHTDLGGVWREVSVDGGIYAIRESRSAAQKGTRIEDETNILQDGTLIDLCGATLLWRSVEGFKASPTKQLLEEKIDMLNATRPQCPVGLNTLVIPRKPVPPANQQSHRGGQKDHHNHHHLHHHHRHKDNGKNSHQPYVYLRCGHVQGYHDWGTTEKPNQRTCPICLSVGNVAKLSMGLEPSFYVDSGPLTHVFNPCGHMASERTVKYWCSIKIPHGTHFFHSICPFCASPLATIEPSDTKLIFQDDLD